MNSVNPVILFDYITTSPSDEFFSACKRVPSHEFSKATSLKGRAICVWKLVYHAAAIILKPAAYFIIGTIMLIISLLFKVMAKKIKIRTNYALFSTKLFKTSLVAPVGQVLQVFKALMGILYPGCYFKKDELYENFVQLAKIGQEVGCEPAFVAILRNGSDYIEKNLQMGDARQYYKCLIKNSLDTICAKLADPAMQPEKKLSILNMLNPLSLSQDPLEKRSGLYACAPGLGRLLEQICGSLTIPIEPKKVIPWLVTQYQVEVLQSVVMQIEISKHSMMCPTKMSQEEDIEIDQYCKKKEIDPIHFCNVLISCLGKKIGLPQAMIDKTSHDLAAQIFPITEDEQEELLKMYNKLYTEQRLITYLIEHINSQPDGQPGLKELRNYIIQQLYEQVSAIEIESCKEEVQQRFNVGEAVADDGIYYVKLYYYLYPDMDPSDERASDLNEEGLRTFMKTLENNPLDYFSSLEI